MNDKKIIHKLEKEFDYMSSKVDEMRAESEHLASDSRDRFQHEVDGLASRIDRLKNEFGQAQSKAGVKWEDFRTKLDHGLEEIKQAFKNVRGKPK